MFKTYRSRLLAYTVLLVIFLTGTLAYTYVYSRNVILEESENSLTDTAQMLNGNLEAQERELLHYSTIVKDDIRIKEYMFMVAMVGTNNEPLRKLYERQYGWLPVEKRLIMANDGRILFGSENTKLAESIREHLETSNTQTFYVKNGEVAEMVTWAPLQYQDKQLGIVSHTHALNRSWLEQHRQYSAGFLFLEHNGHVLLSSLPETEGSRFEVLDKSRVVINNDSYRIRPIILSGASKSAPRLWYGVSEAKLLAKLEKQSGLVLTLVMSGCIAVLVMGTLIIRNFSRPLTELMKITRAVAQGNLPVMNKSTATNEIALLSNQFAEMLHALRDKQEEIERVHKELEESAITDSLTRLHYRRYLQDVFPSILAQAQRESLRLTGIMIDVDHFKKINDRYGHMAGDACLIHFSKILKDTSRTNDYVFRVGGEEFLLLSLDDNPDGGKILAEKIRSAIEQAPAKSKDVLIPLTASLGVSHCELDMPADEALTHLLFNADKALYQAKSSGRNQVRIYITADKHSRSIWDYVS